MLCSQKGSVGPDVPAPSGVEHVDPRADAKGVKAKTMLAVRRISCKESIVVTVALRQKLGRTSKAFIPSLLHIFPMSRS